MFPEWVAGYFRNQWPNVSGMGGRMLRNAQLSLQNSRKDHCTDRKTLQGHDLLYQQSSLNEVSTGFEAQLADRLRGNRSGM
ncbi:hypothetical protein J7438_05645 [Thalassotalea sp. G20_0]|uniref:hypothetical protein n=1 Tax=Thalassotalea sp. G20_0 TaxID=2821093 RepID=UPI001ADBC478|nr:hypothetical protein [Thalassotalea sp. G20_0]MBO9493569.1 hypothetical protein [Thalassotalea sp. G20_0]